MRYKVVFKLRNLQKNFENGIAWLVESHGGHEQREEFFVVQEFSAEIVHRHQLRYKQHGRTSNHQHDESNKKMQEESEGKYRMCSSKGTVSSNCTTANAIPFSNNVDNSSGLDAN
jgi:hypothetical protein